MPSVRVQPNRNEDRYVYRWVYTAKHTGFGWFAAAQNNSLVTAHDPGGKQIYALEWESAVVLRI